MNQPPHQWPSMPSFDELLVLAKFAPDELASLQRQLLLDCQSAACSQESQHLIQQLLFQLHSTQYQQQDPTQRLAILFQGMTQQMLQLEQRLQKSMQPFKDTER